MKIAGLTLSDAWAHRVLTDHGVEAYRVEDIPAQLGVYVTDLSLHHHDRHQNYRPWLAIRGELRSITPLTEAGDPATLPFGISQVTFTPGHGETVEAHYEFDHTQLAALAAKGYFTGGFAPPGDATQIEWELPATLDAVILAPASTGPDAGLPVVFTQVRDLAGLPVDLDNSGYDLTEYFADHIRGQGVTVARETALAPVATPSELRMLKARSDALDALFTPEELDIDAQLAAGVHQEQATSPGQGGQRGAGSGAGDRHEQTPETALAASLAEIEAETAAEHQRFLAARASADPTHRDRERVLAVLNDTEPNGTEPDQIRGEGEEPETATEREKRLAAQRRARLTRRAADHDNNQVPDYREDHQAERPESTDLEFD